MGFDLVILAGAKNDKSLSEISKEKYEALINLNERALIDYVVETFKDIKVIDKIIIVGPKSIANRFDDVSYVPGQDSLIDSIKAGLELVESEYSMIATADIPLISVEAIEAFLSECSLDEADFYYPIIPKESIKRRFSKVKGTFINLVEGDFTGGNIFLLRKDSLLGLENFLEKTLKWRKKPWKLAYLLGFRFIIKLLTGQLSLPLIEEEVYNLTNYKGKAVIMDYPEIGFDIDNEIEYRIMKKQM